MMAMMGIVGARKLVLLAAALALALATMGCAGSQGPLSSHGVDRVPTWNPRNDTTIDSPG
jgi:F0F1-type ATP synthase membrane subunit c/vacuolar-type H+-ATPase subunit K